MEQLKRESALLGTRGNNETGGKYRERVEANRGLRIRGENNILDTWVGRINSTGKVRRTCVRAENMLSRTKMEGSNWAFHQIIGVGQLWDSVMARKKRKCMAQRSGSVPVGLSRNLRDRKPPRPTTTMRGS